MNGLTVSHESFLVLVNCALASTGLCLLALVACKAFRQDKPSAKHNLLFAALAITLALPVLQFVAMRSEFGIVAIQSEATFDSSMSVSRDAPNDRESFLLRQFASLSGNAFARTSIAALWIGGTCFALVRLMTGCLILYRVGQAVSPCTDPRAISALDRAARVARLDASPLLATTSMKVGPMVLGVRRPTIILPRQLVEILTDEQILCVLVHECEHVRRRDVLLSRFEQLAVCVYWWNPLVPSLHRQIVGARERSCDDRVAMIGPDSRHYASALLTVAQWTVTPRRFAGTVSLLPRPHDLLSRIRRLRFSTAQRTRLSTVQAVVVIIAFLMIGAVTTTPVFRPTATSPLAVSVDAGRLTPKDEQLLVQQKLAYVRIDGATKQEAIADFIRGNESEQLRGLIVDLRESQCGLVFCQRLCDGSKNRRACALPLRILAERREPSGLGRQIKTDRTLEQEGGQTAESLYRMVERQVEQQQLSGRPQTPVVVLVQIQGVSSAVMLQAIPPPRSAQSQVLPRHQDDDLQLRVAINMLSHV